MTYQTFVKGSISRYSGGIQTSRQQRRAEATQQKRERRKARKARQPLPESHHLR
jgi:hypothetical protein